MQGDRLCEKCGQLIPRGTTECPICANPLGFSLRRETLLLLCFVMLAVLFGVTGVLVKQYHARERALARQWYVRGEEKLRQGNPASAIPDFRTALFHSGQNPGYQLQLAQSLVASGHVEEARVYLIRLWEGDPASGPVNLELARLAEREADIPQVISYYHNAIDGVWPGGAHTGRRDLRQDLCEYLIDHGHRTEALAELMALSSETPDDARLLTQVAGLFLKAQDYDSALKEYLRSLRRSYRQPQAWAGAGKAAFLMGDYHAARSYLSDALAENPGDTESARLLATTDHVLETNPFDRRVPAETRRRRAVFDFKHALARLEACAKSQVQDLNAANPQTDLQKLYAASVKMKPQMQESFLRRNPDLLDSGMSLVFQIEQATARECGPPSGIDQALLLIGQKNRGGAN
ncbi:MAG: tetratricopeptide repeat protein [Terriglobia bacterium]